MQTENIWTRSRQRLFPVATPPGILAMSLLGSLCGVIAGLSISALHVLIDLARGAFFAPDHPLLDAGGLQPLLSCTLGALLIGLIYQRVKPRTRGAGFVHIVERLQFHQGQLPWRNALVNFFGTVLAVGSGQVVGREGAASHLGAAGGSLLGQYLELPNTTLRALVGCGAAAGIAASFNTPLAGVIFTMEVIVMEYSVIGLAPIIIAAVSANAVAHVWLSSHPALAVSAVELQALSEIPLLLVVGILIGLIAAVYVQAVGRLTHWLQGRPVWLPIGLTGLLTGLLALLLPALSQDGFFTINSALGGELPLGMALGLAVAVLLCSGLAIASAIPGGLILPSMLAGACLGSAFGSLGQIVPGLEASEAAFYALLGLGAMMGAVLQAPLTALIVILELSGHTEMVFPAMLTVITAVLVSRQSSGSESIVELLLRNRGLDFRNDPVSQSLRRISVMAAMNRNFIACPDELKLGEARQLLTDRPDWLLVRPAGGSAFIVTGADVLHALNAAEADDKDSGDRIVLSKIPADRRQCAPVHLRASLQEAWERFEQTGAEALYVERPTRHEQRVVYGILTRKAVEKAYRL